MRVICLLLATLCLCSCTTSKTQNFNQWVGDFKREALSKGISQDVLSDAFADIEEPSEDILDYDRKQPESTKTFQEYVSTVVTQRKITAAREQWQSHKELLGRIEQTYGMPAPILLALWGVESNFGTHQGNYNIIESLVTLAYDGRRSQFFRGELLNALEILQEEHKPAKELIGSWAGAMGQIQFMPSSFLKFAVDFDGDGKKDIWTNDADALASMANYLHQRGWNPSISWGTQVLLPERTEDWADMSDTKPVQQWQQLGLKLINGNNLPTSLPPAHLVLPDDDTSSAFLVYSNYNVIMDWNHSTYFATSIGLLANAIQGQP